MTNILWFKDIRKEDIGMVGGKGANLGEMASIELPVPPGFSVTSEAYDSFLKYNDLNEVIFPILKEIDVENTSELQKAARKIQEIILDSDMPKEIEADIINAYQKMGVNQDIYNGAMSKEALEFIKAGRELPYVAARSSATAEDLPEASFAGQQATYLNLKGNKKVVQGVQKCWASLFTARAIYYRTKNNFPHEQVLISVIVQKMVNSAKSGVIFSANPMTNNKEEIVIEAGYGLGEAVVSGSITPDQYVVDKNTLEIKSKKFNDQEFQYTLDLNLRKTVKRSVDPELKGKQILEDHEIVKLAKYAKNIEKHYGMPQDIEYGIERNNIYILQSRAITTIKEKNAEEIEKEEKEIESIKGELILEGSPASPGVASGVVRIVNTFEDLTKVEKGDILVTRMTNPDMVPTMQKAAAIVTDQGGATCHAAIVSREMGIPCIVGTENGSSILKDGDKVTVDATNGKIYKGEVNELLEKKEVEETISEPVGDTITEVKVLTDLPDFAEKAASTGADGVGLLRLEFMIANNKIHPAKYIREGREEEYTDMLVENIQKISEHFNGKSIWVRTSDLRTDEYRNLEGGDEEPKESDPMIGWHGVRRGLDEPKLMKAEFKAIKKLHDLGHTNVGVMIPFVINVEEVRKCKELLVEVGLEPCENVEFGVMIETPASVGIIEDICKEGIDFVSFGTNDLTQLTLGIDRNNARIQKYYDEMHPAILKQIEKVIKACKRYNVETSICGQAGSDPDMVEYLVGLGIDSISANVGEVQKIRGIIAKSERKLLLKAVRENGSSQ